MMQDTEQTQMTPPAPEQLPEQPEGNKKSGPSFFAGFAIGLAAATAICIAVFLIWYRVAPGKVSGGSAVPAGAQGGEELLNPEAINKLNELNEAIDAYYYKDSEVDIEARRNGMYDGLISSLGDPYAAYYTAEDRQAQLEQLSGVYYGIGAYVTMHQDVRRVYISGVIPDSPAEAAAIRENDIIWAVDGTSTEGMETEDVVLLIRGPEGTKVTLTLLRDNEEIEITVTRGKVESPTVTHEMMEDGIGYLQIREFDDITTSQFDKAMQELYAEGMRGLVLDLRSNPGGSLKAVVEICNLLLPEGEVVYTLDKYGNRESYTSDGTHEIQIPLVVLVNGNSASASEILAGAIKDYEKGTLLGTTTYGKGIVQRIFDFDDDTGVKLTVSDYYTPKGNNIHGVGIEPDVVLEFDPDAYEKDETDNQLEEAKTLVLDMIQ